MESGTAFGRSREIEQEGRLTQASAGLGITTAARYRTVAEAQIVELLALHGWVLRLQGGDRAAAVEEARHALEQRVAGGLAFERGPGGDRRFDPAEVLNGIKRDFQHSGDPLYRERFIATGRGLVCSFHAGRDAGGVPPAPTALPPQRFSVALERTFGLAGYPVGKPIHLRLPLPLEGPALRGLSIASTRSSSADTVFTVRAGRLDARLSVPADGTVTLGAEVSFVASPIGPASGPARLPPDEAELYTRPREGLIQVDERIRALALEIARSAREPQVIVDRFWSFVRDRLTIGVMHYDEVGDANPLHAVLDRGWCDCRLGSALLIALCRARGLPARMASGYMLYSASPFSHFWMEVWVEDRGWVPLDLFSADLSAMGLDSAWRDYFHGCLDYRMQTQLLPRFFDSSPALRFPASWYTLGRSLDDGVEIGI